MKNHTFIKVIILISSLFFSSSIPAEEYPSLYKGIRPMGMGGAFVAVSNDANALFYNPAGLSFVPEKSGGTALTVEIEAEDKEYGAFRDAVTDASRPFNDVLDIDSSDYHETVDFLRGSIGDYYHSSVAIFPHYVKPHLAFGVFATDKTNYYSSNYQFPSISIDRVRDIGAAAGYAQFLDDGLLSIGANAKLLTRTSLDGEYALPEITTSDFDDRLDDDTENGFDALIDVGIIRQFKDIKMGKRDVVVSLGLNAANIIKADTGDAQDVEGHVDLGIALKSDSLTLAFDYIDLFNSFNEDDDKGKRMRAGVEYLFRDYLVLRAGLYQGYPTFGVSINGKRTRFDLLTYAEEVGTYSGEEDDRRYAIGFSLNL